MRSKSCFCKNFETTSGPNVNETPRSFSPQPVTSLSGSDHSKSQSKPRKYKEMFHTCQTELPKLVVYSDYFVYLL